MASPSVAFVRHVRKKPMMVYTPPLFFRTIFDLDDAVMSLERGGDLTKLHRRGYLF